MMSSAKCSKFFEIRIKQAVAGVEAEVDLDDSVKIPTILHFVNWSTMKRKWNSEQALIEQVVDEVALDCIAVDFPQSTLEPQNIFENPNPDPRPRRFLDRVIKVSLLFF